MYHMAAYVAEKRWSSMCMQINDFDHDDCPTPPWCSCDCHKAPDDTVNTNP